MKKHRIRRIAPAHYEIRHPDGYWVGPGSEGFRSVAAALDWFYSLPGWRQIA